VTTEELFQTELQRIVKILKDKYEPDKIVLYGSMNEGRLTKDSDIDILIIKKTSLPLAKRIQEVYMLLLDLNYKIPLEPLVFTPLEIKERISWGDPFIKEVTSRGKIIYEKQ